MTTDTIGGVWNFSISLARALRSRGTAVHLATMGRVLSAAQRLQIADFPFHESEFPLEWMPNAWAGVDGAGEWLINLEREIKPDVVHHNTVSLAHLSFQVPSVVTVHSCVWSWWEAVKRESPPSKWDEYHARVTRSLRAAADVIAPSRTMLAEIRRIYGVEGQVIPNFVEKSGTRCTKEPFVFAAGRVWDEAKNLGALERCAPRLSWPVRIAGEGSSLGYLGPAEIERWHARASIYAWPAKYEPFGLSVLEAAQHGCALVLGDISSLRENWDGAAHFVSCEDSLVSTIERLIADSELRLKWSRRARKRSERFTESFTANAYSAAYAEVLSGSLCAS